MSQPFLFSRQVGIILTVRIDHNRDPGKNFDAMLLQASDFVRIIREQTHASDAQITEDARGHAVVPQIGCEAQSDIGFHGIQTFFLQRVGSYFVHKTDASAFLAQVQEDPSCFICNRFQCEVELFAAVALKATQNITRQTFAVKPDQNRCSGESDPFTKARCSPGSEQLW